MSCDAPMDSSSPGDITLRRTAEVKALKHNNKLGVSYGKKTSCPRNSTMSLKVRESDLGQISEFGGEGRSGGNNNITLEKKHSGEDNQGEIKS